MRDNIEILYDHYKDSFEQIKANIVKREKYFILAILLLLISMFAMFNPSYMQDVTGNIVKEKFGIDLKLAFYSINSALVLLSLWYIIRYYQTVLTIENLYTYVHKVESKLCALIQDFEICREGKSYLSSYPILKSCIYSFYLIVIPLIVIAASFIKIYWELYITPPIPILSRICDILCLSIIIILTMLYLSWIHFRDFKKNKDEEVFDNGL